MSWQSFLFCSIVTMRLRQLPLLLLLDSLLVAATNSSGVFEFHHFHASVVSVPTAIDIVFRIFGNCSRATFFFSPFVHLLCRLSPKIIVKTVCVRCVCVVESLFICILHRIRSNVLSFFVFRVSVNCDKCDRATWLQTADGIYWFIFRRLLHHRYRCARARRTNVNIQSMYLSSIQQKAMQKHTPLSSIEHMHCHASARPSFHGATA